MTSAHTTRVRIDWEAGIAADCPSEETAVLLNHDSDVEDAAERIAWSRYGLTSVGHDADIRITLVDEGHVEVTRR